MANEKEPIEVQNENDANRSKLLVEREKFVAWMGTPQIERVPKTLTELADELSVSRTTLWRWRQNAEVLAEIKVRIRTIALRYLPGAVKTIGERAEAEADVPATKFLWEKTFGEEAPTVQVNTQVNLSRTLEDMVGDGDDIVLSAAAD